MARIIFPVRFLDKVKLISDISAKHTADGVGSVLTSCFTQNDIAIADDLAASGNATTQHLTMQANGRSAEKLFKERDRLFNPVFTDHRGCVQFLKRLFAKNPALLGDWGVTVNGNKIVYPVDVQEKILAVLTFIAKHNDYPPGDSPLQVYLDLPANADVDLAQNSADASTANTNHTDAINLNNSKETARAQRDLLMETPIANYTIIGNYLVNLFRANPNTAGDWGFTIDSSPQGSKVRTGFVNISGTKTIASLVANSVLINNSDFNIEIYKGKTVSGPAVVLQPGKKFPITAGYGTLTIKNPSTEEKALYQGVFNK